MQRLRLASGPRARTAFACLNVLPLPGLGALLAGWRNPHTDLRRNGALQLLLLAGAYPWIVPGLAALVWGTYDALRIAKADLVPPEARAAPRVPAEPASAPPLPPAATAARAPSRHRPPRGPAP